MVRVRGGVAVRAAAAETVVPVRLGDLLQNKVLAARHADDGFVGADLVPQQVVRVITRTALSACVLSVEPSSAAGVQTHQCSQQRGCCRPTECAPDSRQCQTDP